MSHEVSIRTKDFDAAVDALVLLSEEADGCIVAHFAAAANQIALLEASLIDRKSAFFSKDLKELSVSENNALVLKREGQLVAHVKQRLQVSTKPIGCPILLRYRQILSTIPERFQERRRNVILKLPAEVNVSTQIQEVPSFDLSRFPISSWVVFGGVYPRDLSTLKFVSSTKSVGGRHKELRFPWGIAVNPKTGNIYVAEEDRDRLLVLSPDLIAIDFIGDSEEKTVQEEEEDAANEEEDETGSDNDGEDSETLAAKQAERALKEKGKRPRLKGPRGVAVSVDGRVAVVQYGNHDVLLLDENLRLIRRIGRHGDDMGFFTSPYHACFDSNGYLYVADSGNRCVQKFDNEGNFVTKYGGRSEGPGQISSSVNGVFVDVDGYVYVLAAGASVIRVFASDGNLHREIPIERIGSGGWANLNPGPFNTLVISDTNNSAIKFYDNEGTMVSRIDLDSAMGAVFGLDGRFYATSVGNHSINIY